MDGNKFELNDIIISFYRYEKRFWADSVSAMDNMLHYYY